METKTAINFLMYSYFGLTLESEKNEIIVAVVNKAYQDANRHVVSIPNENEKLYAKGKSFEKLIKCISNLWDNTFDRQDDYKEWHKKVCSELVKLYSGITAEGKEFTCGVAQKWVNMIMKYLYVIKEIFEGFGDNNETNMWLKKLSDKNFEQYLHIPIDSFILENISRKTKKKEDYTAEFKIEVKNTDGSKGFYSYRTMPWSKYEDYEEDYYQLQKRIRGEVKENSILDWENLAWIKVNPYKKKKEIEVLRKRYEKIRSEKE